MLIDEQPETATRRYQVLNVRERGILIDDLQLPVGAHISFILAGRGINHAESGRVAYRTDTATGVAVDPWHEAPEAIRALISGETELGPRLKDAYITRLSRFIGRLRPMRVGRPGFLLVWGSDPVLGDIARR
ncbi:MAG: hypothetical protein ACLP01_24855 [Solirubrobacteraceae bacterium]